MLTAILPASGSASRMGGLPKFLLPSPINSLSILGRHLQELKKLVDQIVIPVNPLYEQLLHVSQIDCDNVKIFPLSTQTMSETILKTTYKYKSERILMVMPDTFFRGDLPYSQLVENKAPMNLAVWKIREDQMGKLGQVNISETSTVIDVQDKSMGCEYPYAWGAMSMDRKFLEYLDPKTAHIGFLIPELLKAKIEVKATVVNGEYYDCGTPTEYIRMIRESAHD